MTYEQPSTERRQHMRVNARGSVILRGCGREIRGRSIALSETTLEVRCHLGFMLLAMAGCSLEIEMRLDGAAGTWFLLHGQVARVRAADHSLVIAIGGLPAPLAALLATNAERTRARPIEVMVIDSVLARRLQVADAFRVEGCHVVEASTPLEAIDALGSTSYVTDVITVADTVPGSIAVELRNYLDGADIDALVVAVGDPEWTPTRARLDPSHAEGLLPARMQSLLLLRPLRQERHAGAAPVMPTVRAAKR